MSIASEITRLQGVKSDILTAIADKGVTVPAGSALDDCPGLISRINGYVGIGKRSGVSNKYWYITEQFDLTSASKIEENIVCKAYEFGYSVQFHICGGQWFGNSATFYGVTTYIWSDKVEFDVKGGTEYYVNDIPYSFDDWIRKNVIYDKNSGVITCKVYYNDVLVCTKLFSIEDVIFGSSISYCIGGNRNAYNTNDSFSGEIDFSKSYIKLDDVVVWGVEP